jgi:Fe-S-cluster-containing dehydrogenase component
MMNKKQKNHPDEVAHSRRNFLKYGFISGAGTLAAGSLISSCQGEQSGETIKVLTTDGKVIEVDKASVKTSKELIRESHQGIPGRKFAMVIDLAKCKNARKCVEKCQEGHHLPPHSEYMRVYLMQDSDKSAPYWFPKPCYHCDNPLCVSVCPVGATYKRSDGIVLVDQERCIGCKFCMTGCPYSARIFAWKKEEEYDVPVVYNPETTVPHQEGTVSKCVFCADRLEAGKLPHCVLACPMGVIYFGDVNEDAVTNGDETVKFSELIQKRSGFRYLESLGTRPNVYYLPPVNRQFPVERGYDDLDESLKERYKDTPYVKSKSKSQS